MTPNLLVATQTLFSPHKWFNRTKSERSIRKTEQWDDPIPGSYEYIPGRGWYLVATDNPAERLKEPINVKYSKVLKRYMLQPDYDGRKKYGTIMNDKGKLDNVGFFRLDDGVAWVHCWDAVGNFIPGPYQLWCLDKRTDQFRHMKKGDDPEYIHSRRNSVEPNPDPSRRSQDSRSTKYRAGGGIARDGQRSGYSTRSNSVRDMSTSNPPSQSNTRPGSPKSIPLSEATTLLSATAAEQASATGCSTAPVLASKLNAVANSS